MTDSADWEVATERWRFEVGKLILAFGEIEYGVCQCLVHIPATSQWEALKHAEFKIKANAAIKYAQESKLPALTKSSLVNCLNRAMQLAVNRNLIAHNPLHLGMYMNDQQQLDFRLQIYSLRNSERTMTLAELTEVAELATALSMELTLLAGEQRDDT